MAKKESQKDFWKRLSLKQGRPRALKGKRWPLLSKFISNLVRRSPSLENHASATNLAISSFIEDLARAQPDPGGGAAAAYGISLSLALVEKVVRLELQRAERSSDRIYLWENSLAQLRQLRIILSQLQERDVQAYFNLMKARAEDTYGQGMLEAVHEAANCPLQIMKQALAALAMVSWIGGYCRKHLVSDLLVSCEMIRAALQGAYHIAAANLDLLDEPSWRDPLEQELTKTSQEGRELFLRVREKLESRE
jgi:formiminotetrahydrofolate cyclodeaminase